ncbi:hypothetical protein HY345_01595 [Candidatus Microgenomates bacterium]|nr:hypothetical protein [Candidatus Microgenomates bacterium]
MSRFLEIDLRRQFAIESVLAGKVKTGSQTQEVIFSADHLPFASHVFPEISFKTNFSCPIDTDSRINVGEINRVASQTYLPAAVENEFDRGYSRFAEIPVLGKMIDSVQTLFDRQKQQKMLKKMFQRQVSEGFFPDHKDLPRLHARLMESDASWIAKDVVVATLAGWSGNLFALSIGMLKSAEGVVNGTFNATNIMAETAFVFWIAPMVLKLAYTIPRIVMESKFIAQRFPLANRENLGVWRKNAAIFASVLISDFLPVISWGAHGLLTSQRNGELASLTMRELKSSVREKRQKVWDFLTDENKRKTKKELKTKIKDKETLIVATLDIGKGNLLYAKLLKDTLQWMAERGYLTQYKRAEVVYLDRLIDSLPRRFNFWLVKKIHGFIARHGLVSQVYSLLTERGIRNNFVFGKWLGKPLADLLEENGHKAVVATSTDAAGAIRQNGKRDLKVIPISTDLSLRNSAIGKFSRVIIQSWDTAQRAGAVIKKQTGFLTREDLRDTYRETGLLVHPRIIDSLPDSLSRRERRFSEETAEALNIFDVASGSGVNLKRAQEILKGFSDGVRAGEVNLTFWMGKDRRAVIKILNLARKMNLPVEVVDRNKYRELGQYQSVTEILFGRPISQRKGTGIKLIYDRDLGKAMDLLIEGYIQADVLSGGPDETTLWAAGCYIPKITHTQDARGSWEKANAFWSRRMGISLDLARGERKNLSEILRQMQRGRYKGYNFAEMLEKTRKLGNPEENLIRLMSLLERG